MFGSEQETMTVLDFMLQSYPSSKGKYKKMLKRLSARKRS